MGGRPRIRPVQNENRPAPVTHPGIRASYGWQVDLHEIARQMLVKQNRKLFVNVKVTRFFTRRPLGVEFAVRDEATATKMLEQRFVNFGLFRPIATSYHTVAMCMRCCGYDHLTDKCTDGFVMSARCSSPKHTIDTCSKTAKMAVRCFYCAARGEDDSRHPATSLALIGET